MADNASIKHSVKSSRHRCWHHLLKELEKESVSQRLRASTKGARLSLYWKRWSVFIFKNTAVQHRRNKGIFGSVFCLATMYSIKGEIRPRRQPLWGKKKKLGRH